MKWFRRVLGDARPEDSSGSKLVETVAIEHAEVERAEARVAAAAELAAQKAGAAAAQKAAGTVAWEARKKELEPLRQARAQRQAELLREEEVARAAEERAFNERLHRLSSFTGLQTDVGDTAPTALERAHRRTAGVEWWVDPEEYLARRESEHAARLAKMAEAHALDELSSLLGVSQGSRTFSCVECQGAAEVPASAKVYTRLVTTELGIELSDWIRIKSVARPSPPLRTARLARELGITYDDSVKVIDAGVRLGLLDEVGTGVVAAQPRCAECYERRAPVTSNKREPVLAEVRREVWRRDQGRCVHCGSQKKLEYDHTLPVSKGGSNTARNIQLLCERCNRSKGASIG
jgi:5-methylcytosine-specific restriction endonuclease McrA